MVQSVPEDQQHECPICGSESSYVFYDGDKMCENCGHAPGVENDTEKQTEWDAWLEHRRENYSGWYGSERVRFVGGFIGAWDRDEL